MKSRICVLFPVLFLAFLSPCCGYTWQEEKQLRDAILNTTYDTSMRPSSPLKIYGRFIFFSLNELTWTDPRLAWTAANYNGITSITAPYGAVWTPPLVVENSADSVSYLGSNEKVHIRIYDSGLVKWMTPTVITVTCAMDIVRFPFDSQTCGMTIYTWAHDIGEMFIEHPDEVGTNVYSPNGEWEYKGSSVVQQNVTDATETLYKITINLHFKRQWLFLGLSLIIPAILNPALMCAVFGLSFESGEKLGYCLTVLLSYIVLLTMVGDNLPPVSTEISVLQVYLTTVMCVDANATLLTVLNVTVYNLDPEKPRPDWVNAFCRSVLIPLACQTRWWKELRCGCKRERKQCDSRTKIRPLDNAFSRASQLGQNKDKNLQNSQENPQNGGVYLSAKRGSQPPEYTATALDGMAVDNADDDLQDDFTWKEVAELLDAVFLRIVSFFIGLGTIMVIIFFMVV